MNGLLLIAKKSLKTVENNIKNGYEKPYEVYGCHKDGREFPIRIESREIIYKGKSTRVTEFNDITEEYKSKQKLFVANEELQIQSKKLAETNKELVNYQEHLEDLVKKRTIELENSLQDLKQTQDHIVETEKMTALGGLVAGISHEINTPVGLGITSMTHFVDETKKIKELYYADNISQNEFEEYLETSSKLASITYQNLKRTAELVSSFKQISIDQTSEEKREFHLKNYVKEIFLSLHNRLKKTKIDIELNCSDNSVVNSFPGIYAQIITNLIMNSLIHAFDENEKGKITLNFNIKNSILYFVYTDDGKGIDKEDLKKIFNPFFTTKRKFGGSGLGLNVIYNLVTQRLNGTVTCKSEKGKGVEFDITIPL